MLHLFSIERVQSAQGIARWALILIAFRGDASGLAAIFARRGEVFRIPSRLIDDWVAATVY
jgi:hypothetical protein